MILIPDDKQREMYENDIAPHLKKGQARYGFFCNNEGGVIDDVIIYKLNDLRFFVCVNAGNVENVFNWLNSNSDAYKVAIKNLVHPLEHLNQPEPEHQVRFD